MKTYFVFPSPCGVWVVSNGYEMECVLFSFRPLAGCGLLPYADIEMILYARFRPLAGCGLFPQQYLKYKSTEVFPSPCGVWVVSAKLHILSGATGKRIVNSAILLYHIGRCLSIAN